MLKKMLKKCSRHLRGITIWWFALLLDTASHSCCRLSFRIVFHLISTLYDHMYYSLVFYDYDS